MTDQKREEIAEFRYSLIAPIVKYDEKNLNHGEKYAILREIVSGNYPGISMDKEKIGIRTLERYLSLYAKGGKEALKPKKRERSKRIPEEYFEIACNLKKENMSRSIENIIYMAEHSGRVPVGALKRSTVYDVFIKNGLTKNAKGSKTGRYTRYGASYRSEILQGDTHYTLKLPDPKIPNQSRQVYLFAWLDDYSRLVNGQFYWKEQLPALEDSLKKWIILYGVPESIFCDNGAVYSSNHLANICSSLGIQLLHSRPYRPQGKGKIEKFFQIVESSFKSEIELLLQDEKIKTLNELNQLFSVWLHRFYNKRVHSATKQSPLSRWNACDYSLKKPTLETIYEAFLCKEERAVSKTGIFSLLSNEYEVEPFLCSKKITVRYDPYNITTGVRVYFDGKQFKDAIPAKIHRHSKKGYSEEPAAPVPSTGINFLEQLGDMELTKKEIVNFSNLLEGSDFL